jgi:hypothetical protein
MYDVISNENSKPITWVERESTPSGMDEMGGILVQPSMASVGGENGERRDS